MCVIIERNPGIVIPAEKIEQACDINKHGFGITYVDNGGLRFIRSVQEPNDPKIVADHLQQLKDRKIWLHLRHATVGAVNKTNNHPFLILSKKKHGMDLAFMHNGTLYSYKPKDGCPDSDTLVFAREFVTPIALRLYAFNKQRLLTDEWFTRFMKVEAGYSSVVVFVDGNGNTAYINKDKGKDFEGWWASNDYSFWQNHHRSSTRETFQGTSHHHGYMGEDLSDEDSALWWERHTGSPAGHVLPPPWKHEVGSGPAILMMKQTPEGAHYTFSASPVTNILDLTKTRYECQKVGVLIEKKVFKHGESIMSGGAMMMDLKKLKTSFSALAGIPSLADVGKLGETDLIDMCKDYPMASARLILELLGENVSLNSRVDNQKKTIEEMREHEKATGHATVA